MAKKKANSQFPDVLYIAYSPDDDDGYFVAERDVRFHAEVNAKIRIGIYRLEKIGDVSAEPVIVDLADVE